MNKTFKRILIGAAAAAVCAGAAVGGWLLFDANVDRSGWKLEAGNYSYQDFHAHPVTGWQDIDGKRYYFGDDHIMYTGWREVDGRQCYFGQSGVLRTGWQSIGSGRYYLGADGGLCTGWQDIDGGRYYFGTTGAMTTGWLELDGQRYYLNGDGTLASGWKEIGGAAYCFTPEGTPHTGLTALEDKHYYFDNSGIMTTGWVELEDKRHYFADDGIMALGWTELDGSRYYFDEDGAMVTGWLALDAYKYYLKEDGTMAVGPTVIGEQTYYFSPHGVHILLVNPWNYLPADLSLNLVQTEGGYRVDESCLEALEAMLAGCREAGNKPSICSGYRTMGDQQYLFNNKIQEYKNAGYPDGAAYANAKRIVAIPGTSEHQLGLALDIVADDYWILDDSQAGTKTQRWLMDHCWEYGFILRYPEGSTDITGIIYEPWHYRYVGVEIAMELRDLGITLEEYLGAVPTEA